MKNLIIKIFLLLFSFTFLLNVYTKTNSTKNILLITIDTLRADYISVIDEHKIKTPNIDSLANKGILFTHIFSTAPLTLPSHISILTGTYPFTHRVRNNGQVLNNTSVQSINSVLKNYGYNTYAITASYVLHSSFGLSKDFDYYSNVSKTNSLTHSVSTQFIERKAEEVVSIASKLIPYIKKPFFFWIHFYDPHAPYNPPPNFTHGSPAESYIGEIEYTDFAIGKLLNLLKINKLTDNLIICITSDHGESLGQHKEKTHGHFLYNSTLRVPLILYYDNAKPKKITSYASSIDIAPTLLNLINLPIPNSMQGSSLLPVINSNKPLDKKTIYAETFQPFLDNNWAPLFSIIIERKKYIYAPKQELYDLTNDFNESYNIITNSSNQIWFNKIQPYLKFPHSLQKLDNASKEALLSLGYAGSSNPTLPSLTYLMNLPDPKDTINDLELIHSAMDEINNSNLDEAAKILLSLHNKDKSNTRTLYLLSLIYKNKNDYNNALQYLKKAANINSDYLSHYYLLSAESDIKKNNLLKAEHNYLKAIEFNPYETAAYYNLSQLAYAKKDLSSAKNYLKKTLELEPENFIAANNLAMLLLNEKKYNEAEKLLLNNFNLYPDNELIINNLVKLYLNKKDYHNAYNFLRIAISINPNNENNYLLIISCCQYLNAKEELINYRYKLAELYSHRNLNEKALAQLNAILKIDPSNQKALYMLKQIQNAYPPTNNYK